MSDAILPDSNSTAICGKEKIIGHWPEYPTSTAIPPTSASDIVEQHIKKWGVTLGVTIRMQDFVHP